MSSDMFGGDTLSRAVGCAMWFGAIVLVIVGALIALVVVWLCGGFK